MRVTTVDAGIHSMLRWLSGAPVRRSSTIAQHTHAGVAPAALPHPRPSTTAFQHPKVDAAVHIRDTIMSWPPTMVNASVAHHLRGRACALRRVEGGGDGQAVLGAHAVGDALQRERDNVLGHTWQQVFAGEATRLAYASPEVICGRPFDGAADIYSAGAVIYYALARTPPFQLELATP